MKMNRMYNAIKDLRRWLTLADYETAKTRSTKKIIARLGRGNVVFQNGGVLDERRLAKMSADADQAVLRLKRRSTSKQASARPSRRAAAH